MPRAMHEAKHLLEQMHAWSGQQTGWRHIASDARRLFSLQTGKIRPIWAQHLRVSRAPASDISHTANSPPHYYLGHKPSRQTALRAKKLQKNRRELATWAALAQSSTASLDNYRLVDSFLLTWCLFVGDK